MNSHLNNSFVMPRFRKRFRLRRRRVGARRTVRRARGRYRLRSRRSGTLRYMQRGLKRLFSIVEPRVVYTITNQEWRPWSNASDTNQGSFASNVQIRLLELPQHEGRLAISGSTANITADSRYTGNSYNPFKLVIKGTTSLLTFINNPAEPNLQVHYDALDAACYVRIVVAQIKAGDIRYNPFVVTTGGDYHPLCRIVSFGDVQSDAANVSAAKAAWLSYWADAPQDTNYANEHMAPLRRGITRDCTILGTKRFTLNTSGTAARSWHVRCRTPRPIFYPETYSTSNASVPVFITPNPINPIVVFTQVVFPIGYINRLSQMPVGTVQNNLPVTIVNHNLNGELHFRDA